MQFTQAGVALPFEVTYDAPGLFVAMNVFDVTTGVPALVTQVPMVNYAGNSYFALFTPLPAHSYAVNKGVYTDGTYTTYDSIHSQGSDSFRSDDIAGLVWNALTANYTSAGSFGLTVQSGGINPVVVANAVWNALLATYNVPGTMGSALNSVNSGESLNDVLEAIMDLRGMVTSDLRPYVTDQPIIYYVKDC